MTFSCIFEWVVAAVTAGVGILAVMASWGLMLALMVRFLSRLSDRGAIRLGWLAATVGIMVLSALLVGAVSIVHEEMFACAGCSPWPCEPSVDLVEVEAEFPTKADAYQEILRLRAELSDRDPE